jgi:hypothetical protein
MLHERLALIFGISASSTFWPPLAPRRSFTSDADQGHGYHATFRYPLFGVSPPTSRNNSPICRTSVFRPFDRFLLGGLQQMTNVATDLLDSDAR